MNFFLEYIVDTIEPRKLNDLRSACYVFPSQRSCRHFERLLKDKFPDNVFWMPKLFSLQEFIEYLNPTLVLASDIQLITELYAVYKKKDPTVVFEEFYGWAKILIKDFDEIDRYLVDAKNLYKNLQNIKDINQIFGPNEDELKAINEFQKIISVSKKGKIFKEFESVWETIGTSFFLFQEALLKKGLAHNGMLYRRVAETIDERESFPFKKVVFSGFNALSLSEETIFSVLLKKGIAQVYFDIDRFYFNTEKHEASKFLKKYKNIWKNENVYWIDANGFESTRTIDVFGTTSSMNQAKITANILTSNTNYIPQNTAVILADESLLYPILYALPQKKKSLNVTMGTSAFNHSIGEFIGYFFEYHAGLIRKKGIVLIPIELLQTVISNSFLQEKESEFLRWISTTKQNYTTWSFLKKFKLSPPLLAFLCPLTTPMESFDVAMGMLKIIHQKETSTMHSELALMLHEALNKLKNELLLISIEFEMNFIKKIVSASISTLKIPLGKEIDNGFQIMGFLETRSLDFENIIILSANESFLPASSVNKSFIPFGLKKAFNMPHFSEYESIYAYHFYRVLQRSKRVTLIYNTELSGGGVGEKSRYILQLVHQVRSKKLPVIINESRINIPLSIDVLSSRKISVKKTTEIINQIQKLLVKNSEKHPISPTLILDYIACPLRFYLKRIRKIKKNNDTNNEIDTREFGNIIHLIMQNLYKPLVGKKVLKNDILAIKKTKLEKEADKILGLDTFTGKIEYQRFILLNTVGRLLDKDATQTPLYIKGLEVELNNISYTLTLHVNGMPIILGGVIDRVDKIFLEDSSPLVRIIDYKTGKVEMQKIKHRGKPIENETYISNYFSSPRFKVEFQSYYYALIYSRNHRNENITAGIYGLKTIGLGVQYVGENPQAIPPEFFSLFESNLIKLLENILNPTVEFYQTEEISTCSYCEFNSICGR